MLHSEKSQIKLNSTKIKIHGKRIIEFHFLLAFINKYKTLVDNRNTKRSLQNPMANILTIEDLQKNLRLKQLSIQFKNCSISIYYSSEVFYSIVMGEYTPFTISILFPI